MPAPLGKTVTKKMPKIDVLGLEGSTATRGAIRFFRERRIVVRFVDLSKRPIEAAELRGLVERLGPTALATGARETEAAALLADRGALLARVRAEPGLLRLPIVRHEDALTAGPAEATWAGWLARRGGGAAKRQAPKR
jgi:arsenate reductase-like glutaredoxin family protein